MAFYTIEINDLIKDENFKLFDFDYEFYLESHKPIFEEKFINHYRFNEIGFESVTRFKHYLKERLNLINRYYSQLYETELRSQGGQIDFMLNKDLVETFERDINAHVDNKTSSSTQAENSGLSKESFLDNGNSDLGLNEGNLTGVSGNESSGKSSSEVKTNDDRTEKEGTKLISKGNIGVTSSAQLLKEWRSVLINIDELIIKECSDLFMLIY